MTLSPKN